MSSEREEIRWKFQVMIDNTKFVLDSLDDQWKNFDVQAERALRKVERKRNYRLTGIGFVITVILTLVAIEKLGGYEQIGIITAGVLALLAVASFGLTERMLGKEESVQKEINDLFFDVKTMKFPPIMSSIATFAMDKTITEEQVQTISSYVVSKIGSIDYLFRWKLYQILIKDLSKEQRKEIELSRFSHKPYEKHYNNSKQDLDLFKKSSSSFNTDVIEEFIKSYEKNIKSKK